MKTKKPKQGSARQSHIQSVDTKSQIERLILDHPAFKQISEDDIKIYEELMMVVTDFI